MTDFVFTLWTFLSGPHDFTLSVSNDLLHSNKINLISSSQTRAFFFFSGAVKEEAAIFITFGKGKVKTIPETCQISPTVSCSVSVVLSYFCLPVLFFHMHVKEFSSFRRLVHSLFFPFFCNLHILFYILFIYKNFPQSAVA